MHSAFIVKHFLFNLLYVDVQMYNSYLNTVLHGVRVYMNSVHLPEDIKQNLTVSSSKMFPTF